MTDPVLSPTPHTPSRAGPLRTIKTIHTIVWAGFVASIVGIPLSAWSRHFDYALGLAGIVFVEVLVLLVNGWRCPLTAVAARYTSDRRANFDIYLPEWLARYNKEIFGTLFVFGLLFALGRWMGWLG